MDCPSAGTLNGAKRPAGEPLATTEPVFVLCMGRSGSTLLRFILDAHPDLACPPETSLPALCGQLAVVWSLIEGAPLSATRGDAPPVVPDAAIAGIRHTVDMMTGSYLARRGKRRFCDKSLASAHFVDLLIRIYPEARFICLYRHPMDVIRSGLDACPWGLNGYGFDPYIGGSPGNAVLALARYWLDNAGSITAVEEQYPDRCVRVRYEDLVAAPEQVAQEVFAFIGARPAPGVAQGCFTGERERFGPADHKIWATSAITAGSVGRGEAIPAGLIPPPITKAINELADKLGYVRISEDWGTPGMPADPCVPGTARPAAAAPDRESGAGSPPAGAELLAERLRAGLARIDDRFAARWPSSATESFVMVSRPPGSGAAGEVRWHVDLASRTISEVAVDDAGGESAWNVLGSPSTWQAVLLGEVNLQVAIRRCDLRYCDPGDAAPLAAEGRIALLADLLGLSAWQHSDVRPRDVAQPTSAAVPS